MDSEVDKALAFVLKQSGPSIDKFLELVFSFLKRNTDFYYVCDNPAVEGVGFKPGIAQKLVQRSFNMFVDEPITSSKLTNEDGGLVQTSSQSGAQQQKEDLLVPPVAEEIEVSTSSSANESQFSKLSVTSSKVEVQNSRSCVENATSFSNTETQLPLREPSPPEVVLQDGDTYNGSETSVFKWSQSLEDLDVKIKLGYEVVHRKQIDVKITQNKLEIRTQNSLHSLSQGSESRFEVLLEGEFFKRVNSSNSYWNFDAKNHELHVFLEKLQPAWWKRLLIGGDESDLDMSKLDTTINIEELPLDEQNTIDQLRYDQLCKLKGLPTSKEKKNESLLRKAWNVEGSPFAGTKFDPSKVQFS